MAYAGPDVAGPSEVGDADIQVGPSDAAVQPSAGDVTV